MADDTAGQEPGFKIQGTFCPWVGFDDWLLPDCRLARLVTGYNETDLLRGKASALLVNVAFAAVAFRHANPAAGPGDVADLFDSIPPDQIEAVGFAAPVKASDAGPPVVSGGEPSESSAPSPESPQETSDPSSSGGQRSRTGSASAPVTSTT